MNVRRVSHLLGSIAVAVATASSAGCGSSPITPARIESAMGATFANLLRLQVTNVGLAPIQPAELSAKTTCQKLMAEQSLGAGQWACTILWQDRNRQGQRDTYDLFVTTDGCYTATVSSETLGGPTVKTADGRDIRNLLYTFEGCFATM